MGRDHEHQDPHFSIQASVYLKMYADAGIVPAPHVLQRLLSTITSNSGALPAPTVAFTLWSLAKLRSTYIKEFIDTERTLRVSREEPRFVADIYGWSLHRLATAGRPQRFGAPTPSTRVPMLTARAQPQSAGLGCLLYLKLQHGRLTSVVGRPSGASLSELPSLSGNVPLPPIRLFLATLLPFCPQPRLVQLVRTGEMQPTQTCGLMYAYAEARMDPPAEVIAAVSRQVSLVCSLGQRREWCA